MPSLTAHGVTAEEYLSNPEFERFEFDDGAVLELNAGTELHSLVQINCAVLLTLYLRANRVGHAYTELRCKLPSGAKKRFYLPDVCVVLGERRRGPYLDGAPDVMVEIRSPDDTMSEAVRRMQAWLAAGSRLGWLILPEEQALWILRPGEPQQVLGPNERADGGSLLPGLEFPVSGLFEA